MTKKRSIKKSTKCVSSSSCNKLNYLDCSNNITCKYINSKKRKSYCRLRNKYKIINQHNCPNTVKIKTKSLTPVLVKTKSLTPVLVKTKSLTPQQIMMHQQYKQYINPTNIPDGHCASCAFNTYLLLMNFIEIKDSEAFNPGSNSFLTFGNWFYNTFILNKDNSVVLSLSFISEKNQTIKEFEQIIKKAILQNTKRGEAVILCIDEGVHWYNAYHSHDDKILFIDAQSGKQFHTYSSKFMDGTLIEIIIPKEEYVQYYIHTMMPELNKKKWGGLRKKRKQLQ
jgi:hypothetical protein